MSMIDCYEPDFVRSFLTRNPDSPLHVRLSWQTEVRESLLLTEPAACEAALGDPQAFVLHTRQCQGDSAFLPLSPRERVLNQAALHTVALPGLIPEVRLYTLGILLSWADKQPGESNNALETIAMLPHTLTDSVHEGKLQQQFACLPAIPQVQLELIRRLGSIDFDWQILPESTRKLTLPLQMSLLTLQDANSETLLLQQLHKQWQTTYQTLFAQQNWIFSNYLIYRLYHDAFPGTDGENASLRFFELTTDFCLIRTLLSLWTLDGSALSHDDIYALFALVERWRHSTDVTSLRQSLQNVLPADALLSAFSLLTC
ncbi:TPA: lysine-N-methylase [Citrobacter amalonaticus]|uniref:lysine-N-methylase n=1 Tax=Citrobacter amalonaticus TaxID=35703 RepID=UPI0019068235|nr:lysine-N-methylase [Citrobacter amalonaticus]MBJ9329376.1 lysine-N-methylase [Citrobacter amalonaticus]